MEDITEIDTEYFGIYLVCNDCGAQAKKGEKIKHHPNCIPGESKRWQKFYEENNDE